VKYKTILELYPDIIDQFSKKNQSGETNSEEAAVDLNDLDSEASASDHETEMYDAFEAGGDDLEEVDEDMEDFPEFLDI